MLLLDGQVHHDTHFIPMGNYVSEVGNYLSVRPSDLGNYVSADIQEKRRVEEEARQEARQRAAQAHLEAEARAEEERQKVISGWSPTLEGVDYRDLGGPASDDPRPYYIDVQTLSARPARGRARPYEAKVLIRWSRTSLGPILVQDAGADEVAA